MDTKQIEIGTLPKQYAENIVVGSNDQTFMLITVSGLDITAYAISPEHAKNLAKILNAHVEKFEKNVRAINDVSQGVPSPIQTTDLGPNGQSNSKK